MPLQILGVGLSRTATLSLHRALGHLGFKSVHYDVRLCDILLGEPRGSVSFRRYSDIDALTDIPTACFYKELMAAYPLCKAILTLRETESWWRSTSTHLTVTSPLVGPGNDAGYDLLRDAVRCFAFGAATPKEYIYKKRYDEHNERVQREISADRLLIMDITKGDGWQKLCPFLGVPLRTDVFPHENSRVTLKKQD